MMSDRRKSEDGPHESGKLLDASGRPMPRVPQRNPMGRVRRAFGSLQTQLLYGAAMIGALAAIFTNFEKIENYLFPPAPSVEDRVVFDFWRLRGAFEVPFFLDQGPAIAECEEGSESVDCTYSDTIGAVWRDELRDTRVVADGLINFEELYFGLREFWASNYDRDAARKLACIIISMEGGISLDYNDTGSLTRDTIDEYLGVSARSDRLYSTVGPMPICESQYSDSIGYLILRITNHSNVIIDDLKLSYLYFPADNFANGESASAILLDRMEQKVWSYLPDTYEMMALPELQEYMSDAKLGETSYPFIEPGGSLMIPVYIYRANADGFEDYFYREWRLPVLISFRSAGQVYEGRVRLPRRRNGATVRTYHGWYQQ